MSSALVQTGSVGTVIAAAGGGLICALTDGLTSGLTGALTGALTGGALTGGALTVILTGAVTDAKDAPWTPGEPWPLEGDADVVI